MGTSHGPGGPTSSPGSLADDRYEIQGTLGSGGMGIVVRARDRRLGRDVAIKLLADNLALDEEARERFLREGRAAARLNHPNVVQVFDVGEEAGRPYLVMELVDGPSLADVIRDEGPLDATALEDAARQTLAALEHAHDAGLLHRDIKPANLLRSYDGTVKVTDFGVAEVAEVPGLTRTGHVLGTLPYLAPERMRGASASPATDLYALGASLYELGTGRSPREATSTGDVPATVRALVERCLAVEPERRPASVSAARRILEGGTPTRVLEADAETVAVVAEAGSTRAEGTVEASAAPQAPRDSGQDERLVSAAVGEPPSTGWRVAVLVGVGVVLLLIAVLAFDGDGVDSPSTGTTPVPETSVEPVPPAQDPANTARNLAEWIRDHRAGS